MSADNFFKGLMAGGIAVNKQINDNAELQLRQEEARIRREAADEAKYKFQKQKDFDTQLKGISQDEATANNASQAATDTIQNTDADAVYNQALNTNAAAVAEPNSDATPFTDEQKSGLKQALDTQQLSMSDKANQLAQADAVNKAVDSGATPDLTAINATEAANKPLFDTKFAGATIDPVNRYKFSMRRAQAFASQGDYKSANEIHKQATVDAASEFANAVLTGDRHTAFEIYQSYPNGHHLNSLQIDKDNNVITTDTDGNVHKMSQLNALIGAVALSGDPEKAATLITSRMNAADKAEMADKLMAYKQEHDKQLLDMQEKNLLSREAALKANNDQKNMALLIHALGGGGNGGSGTSKLSADGMDDNGHWQPTKDYFKSADATPNAGNLQANRQAFYHRMQRSNPTTDPEELAVAALHAFGDDGSQIKPVPELQKDGTWNLALPYGAQNYALQKNIDPSSSGLKPELVLPTMQKAAPDAYTIAHQSIDGNDANYKKVVAAAQANPKDLGQQQQLQMINSIRNNIVKYKQYGVPAPVANSATTGSTTTTALPAATQKGRDDLGIGQNPAPFKDSILGHAVSAIGKKFDADAKKAHDNQLNADVRMLLTPLNADNRNNTMVSTQRNQAALRVKQALKEGRIQPSTFTPAQIDAINSIQ